VVPVTRRIKSHGPWVVVVVEVVDVEVVDVVDVVVGAAVVVVVVGAGVVVVVTWQFVSTTLQPSPMVGESVGASHPHVPQGLVLRTQTSVVVFHCHLHLLAQGLSVVVVSSVMQGNSMTSSGSHSAGR
jgi:hypothetical protein